MMRLPRAHMVKPRVHRIRTACSLHTHYDNSIINNYTGHMVTYTRDTFCNLVAYTNRARTSSHRRKGVVLSREVPWDTFSTGRNLASHVPCKSF